MPSLIAFILLTFFFWGTVDSSVASNVNSSQCDEGCQRIQPLLRLATSNPTEARGRGVRETYELIYDLFREGRQPNAVERRGVLDLVLRYEPLDPHGYVSSTFFQIYKDTQVREKFQSEVAALSEQERSQFHRIMTEALEIYQQDGN